MLTIFFSLQPVPTADTPHIETLKEIVFFFFFEGSTVDTVIITLLSRYLGWYRGTIPVQVLNRELRDLF